MDCVAVGLLDAQQPLQPLELCGSGGAPGSRQAGVGGRGQGQCKAMDKNSEQVENCGSSCAWPAPLLMVEKLICGKAAGIRRLLQRRAFTSLSTQKA